VEKRKGEKWTPLCQRESRDLEVNKKSGRGKGFGEPVLNSVSGKGSEKEGREGKGPLPALVGGEEAGM